MADNRISLLHLSLAPGARDTNLATIEQGIKVVAAKGVDLLVTPELSISGYQFTDQIGTSWIGARPDRWMRRVCALALLYRIGIILDAVIGFILLFKPAPLAKLGGALFFILPTAVFTVLFTLPAHITPSHPLALLDQAFVMRTLAGMLVFWLIVGALSGYLLTRSGRKCASIGAVRWWARIVPNDHSGSPPSPRTSAGQDCEELHVSGFGFGTDHNWRPGSGRHYLTQIGQRKGLKLAYPRLSKCEPL